MQFHIPVDEFDRILADTEGLDLKATCSKVMEKWPHLSGRSVRRLVQARTAAIAYSAESPLTYTDHVGDTAAHLVDATKD